MGYDGARRPMKNPTKALAEWISSAENPLTARVMVNRIWQHHFGEGLVRTPNDFGKNGAGTEHPELLDWLASEFIQRGWSVKAVHRLILQSNTYRQSIRNAGAQGYEKIDPENRYFWRWNPLRLEAEVIRDSVLAITGELHPLMGGPGFFPALGPEVLEGAGSWFEPSPPQEQNRRTIYMWQQRSLMMPFVKVFDGAKMDESCPSRGVTNVTPQVFALFNSAFVHQQSLQLAKRIRREAGEDRQEQVRQAFQRVLQRDPSEAERKDALAFLASGSGRALPPTAPGVALRVDTSEASDEKAAPGTLQDLCLVLFNLSEFVYVE